jgi:hypothetical protein
MRDILDWHRKPGKWFRLAGNQLNRAISSNKKADTRSAFLHTEKTRITSFLLQERLGQQRQQQERLGQQRQQQEQQQQQELQQQEQQLQEQEQLLPSYHKRSEPEPTEQQTKRSGSFHFP